MPHLVICDGLRPEPLSSYCGALGVLRLVAEQADADAKGYWQNDRFHLQSKLQQQTLVDFFLKRYQPTPMASPWNAGGGFFDRPADSAITQIERSGASRFAPYREALRIISRTLAAHNLQDKPSTPQLKSKLLKDLHRNLPPKARVYLDTVVSLKDDDPTYHVLFISGGNDGRVDFAKSFMERLATLLLDRNRNSESLLRAALFDTPTAHLEPRTAGPHNPFSTGGLGGSSDEPEAKPLANPWTYILGMEGSLLLAQGAGETPHRPAGYPSAVAGEAKRWDLQLPLWSQPATLSELQERLSEGAAVQGASIRYSFLARNGRAHFAIPAGRQVMTRAKHVQKLEAQLDYSKLQHLGHALAQDPPHPSRILEALGTLSKENTEHVHLPDSLVRSADDGSPEFGLALALSGLGRGLSETPGLNLETQLPHFTGPDLTAKMLNLLRFRARQADTVTKLPTAGGYPRFSAPFWSSHPVHPHHLEAFLAGRLDHGRLERLFHALCLIDAAPSKKRPTERAFLPFPFALAKLAFHQHQDRRPARIEIVDALVKNEPDIAVQHSVRFLSQRHPDFPQDWPRCPTLDPTTARRWAAALLFPISDATYQQLSGDLIAR